jgi:hypothetical protein
MTPADWRRTCPHCSASPAPFGVQQLLESTGEDGERRFARAGACPSCGGWIIVDLGPDSNGAPLAVYPETTGQWAVDHLPGPVSAIWNEAIMVFKVRANASAVVQCGRVLEAACAERQVTGGTLARRITALFDQGLITSDFKQVMTQVRLIRNVGAHADLPVSRESATSTMRFTQQTLRVLFEVPGELGLLSEPRDEELKDEPSSDDDIPPGSPPKPPS